MTTPRDEYDAMLAEAWDDPRWLDVDRVLAAIDTFGHRPVKVERVAPRRRASEPERGEG